MKRNFTITVQLICFALMYSLFFAGCINVEEKSPSQNQSENVTIFSTSGAQQAVEVLSNQFESEKKISVLRNYASTGVLARQIQRGAESDLFVSANAQWVDYLIKKGIVSEDRSVAFTSNSLVLITAVSENPQVPKFRSDYPENKLLELNLTIGDPGYVPVGNYSKMVLDNLGWWNTMKGNLLLAKDVTTVLHYVQRKEVTFGIVYHSEAVNAPNVKIVAEIPQEFHETICFFVVLLNKNNTNAVELFNSFNSRKSREILTERGFLPLEEHCFL
ncbi:molybdate ABC transporter substrate-binding protein [Chitinispirillales bacterium ANBcel5]|uniref:molybdate ABC transporter substrate-binding protein n=1 Tax=Cellulosispirillum alkaliphilum TaxID=3039283 RepID=UPI002A594061|nr:molybdate ABC transporter substrate-binding protein [Chitinispirillales bacterium ANBcel5]